MAPKKSKSESLAVGAICLSKLKGYPGWPSQIIDNEQAPPNVRRAVAPKGSYCVQFFPAGDYSWLPAKDISPLSAKQIDTYLAGNKKSGELLKGYQVAKDPQAWYDERASNQALYAANPAEYDHEQDELADDDDDDDTAASKKRKRKSDVTPKIKQSAADKKKAAASKSKRKVDAQYSDDEPAPKKTKTNNSASAAEPAGLTTVKDWRHKLQKVFLGKGGISADEMPKCKEYFDAMENFEMNKEWLAESKLGKVLKRIGLLSETAIPLESEYKFRDRAAALAAQWTRNLGGEGEPVAANGASTEAVEDVEMAAPAPVEEEEVAASVVEEAPVVEAPVVEAPVVEAPVVEEAKVEEVAPPVVEEVAPAPVQEEQKMEVEPVVENGANGVSEEVVEAPKVEELLAAVEPVL